MLAVDSAVSGVLRGGHDEHPRGREVVRQTLVGEELGAESTERSGGDRRDTRGGLADGVVRLARTVAGRRAPG
jgi:hypothetical protein